VVGSVLCEIARRNSYRISQLRKNGTYNKKLNGDERRKNPDGDSATEDGNLFFPFHWLSAVCVLISLTMLISELLTFMGSGAQKVLGYSVVTCVVTGLGAIPLLFVPTDSVDESWLAGGNSIAAGTMLAASTAMVQEAHQKSGHYDWQVFLGLSVGVAFIKVSKAWLGDEEDGIEALWGSVMERRHFKRAVLIFTVMFCHSAAEGIAIGVAFNKHCESHFGLYVSMLLALQNVPEGTAVVLTLVPRGVSIGLAALIAILTSVPQPIMAVAAFQFVEAFESVLPIGLTFAAGAMIYVSCEDLLHEAGEHLDRIKIVMMTSVSFSVMYAVQSIMESGSWVQR
jgi:zinc transporter ZupT